jgi:hypothetical protein
MKKITEAISAVTNALEGLTADERSRVLKAVVAIFADIPNKGEADSSLLEEPLTVGDIAREGRQWMKRYNINEDILTRVFDIDDGKVRLIAHVPGNSGRAQTLNAYVVQGLISLLSSGKAMFDDKDARQLCKDGGFHDEANHSAHLKALGRNVTGSKQNGWKLTTPGEEKAAELVREMANG